MTRITVPGSVMARVRRSSLHSTANSYFEAVARLGSVRKAASELFVVPSAVSHQISALEAELGLPLFSRLPWGVKLTSAGETLLYHMRRSAAEVERGRSFLQGLTGLKHGFTSLATVEGVAVGPVADVLDKFRKKWQATCTLPQMMRTSRGSAARRGGRGKSHTEVWPGPGSAAKRGLACPRQFHCSRADCSQGGGPLAVTSHSLLQKAWREVEGPAQQQPSEWSRTPDCRQETGPCRGSLARGRHLLRLASCPLHARCRQVLRRSVQGRRLQVQPQDRLPCLPRFRGARLGPRASSLSLASPQCITWDTHFRSKNSYSPCGN